MKMVLGLFLFVLSLNSGSWATGSYDSVEGSGTRHCPNCRNSDDPIGKIIEKSKVAPERSKSNARTLKAVEATPHATSKRKPPKNIAANNISLPRTGKASFYGLNDGFAGKKTANGEVYRPNGLTAAHRTLRKGAIVCVKNNENGRVVQVRINDWGPAKWTGREIDLSVGAARQLQMIKSGVVKVTIFACSQPPSKPKS